MKDQSYIGLSFDLTPEAENIQAYLMLFDPLGFHEEEEKWSCYFTRAQWDRISPELLPSLREKFPASPYTMFEMENRNWNAEWESGIEPVRVSERILVSPSWHRLDESPETTVIVIDPKMSFGTGHHPTTRLMLRLLEPSIRGGESVLDVGTGTGILAIAAVKLGAATALGLDTDEWSFENAHENVERNGVADHVAIRLSGIEQVSDRYDILLANITRDDNIRMMPAFRDRLTAEGVLILSGFTRDDIETVRRAASAYGFRETALLVEEEWAALSLRLVGG
ncbi:MAG: 50S ribosomal protein L11 methyltransferase [Bacteroidota bacterium]|nr:50S ribosomal protein L11 methyltransferase [Bacteroidota bacterium]